MEKTGSYTSLPSPLYHGGSGLHQGKWPAPDLSPVSDKILERQVDAEGREGVAGSSQLQVPSNLCQPHPRKWREPASL